MKQLRSLNEVKLCRRYVKSFLDIHPPRDGVPIPKLIIGHTHEPRQNAVFPVDPHEDERWERTDNNSGAYYLNSVSAGRYESLITSPPAARRDYSANLCFTMAAAS